MGTESAAGFPLCWKNFQTLQLFLTALTGEYLVLVLLITRFRVSVAGNTLWIVLLDVCFVVIFDHCNVVAVARLTSLLLLLLFSRLDFRLATRCQVTCKTFCIFTSLVPVSFVDFLTQQKYIWKKRKTHFPDIKLASIHKQLSQFGAIWLWTLDEKTFLIFVHIFKPI